MNLLLSDPAFLSVAATVSGGGGYDSNAQAYITAVEAADGQALETAVKDAINAFVVGCKQDGIWNAIKASCILAGARTLAGALVPLVGVAPTNYNFVSGDYNRKTGLAGNGSTKYLDSNRASNADPQDNAHIAVRLSSGTAAGTSTLAFADNSNRLFTSNRVLGALRSGNNDTVSGVANLATGIVGIARSGASQVTVRVAQINYLFSPSSSAPPSATTKINRYAPSTHQFVFYSIGESLDLALLDTRVTALVNALAAAIP